MHHGSSKNGSKYKKIPPEKQKLRIKIITFENEMFKITRKELYFTCEVI
jgi:hypothetical protein